MKLYLLQLNKIEKKLIKMTAVPCEKSEENKGRIQDCDTLIFNISSELIRTKRTVNQTN